MAEHKYPVRTFGISYICDDCKDVAVEYKACKSESIEGEILFYHIHVCPKCGKEYKLDKHYPYSMFEPIPEFQEEKWWDIFKRKK